MLQVVVVDAVFLAGYFLANIRLTSGLAQLVYIVVWTLATLLVVLRGLSRVRSARQRDGS